MKQNLFLLILSFAFGALNAQQTYRFRTDAPQGFSIESSSASGLSLHYSINEIAVAHIDNGEAKGDEIVLKGCFAPNAEGLPNLPFENRYIAVPQGATVSVKVVEKGMKTLSGIDLLPAAPIVENSAKGLPKLQKDMSVFGRDANFPSKNVSIVQTTQIRGLDVALLNVTPFRYNPVRKTLEVIYDMDIEVSFDGGNGHFGDARYRNPAWDNILRNLVINKEMLPEAHYYDFLNQALHNREEGCEYLIITPDDSIFLAWADTLKQFRLRQGIPTKVATVSECGGNDPEAIRNYLLNAYNHWTIPPAAVLLFGGNRNTNPDFGIKPYVYSIPVTQGHSYQFPSDNPYADMNGDSIPDLAISRLPAYSENNCRLYVKKCIDYELNPPTDAHYYDHPVITSGYEEDKWFLITSQSVDGFFRNHLGKHPTNLYMVFDQMNPNVTPPDSIWSTATNTEAVLDYFGPNGANYIPTSIGALDDWKTMMDKQLLSDAISDGTFLTLYRDHSANESWGSPYFHKGDVRLLRNLHPTFIFSIGCLTNNFWDAWTVCLMEEFIKSEVGAIGGIGSTSVTYSHFNDLLTWGMFDYIWPDFMPTLGSQNAPEIVYPSFSLVAGKMFLGQQSFLPHGAWPTQTEKTLNLFNYLGETYINLFTEAPQLMAVEASAFQREDQHEYTIKADEGALICIAKGDEILYLRQATGQTQTFTLPNMQPAEQFNVTVTKANHKRFHRNVTITPASGPYMVMENYLFRDESGNDTLEFGETARIDLTLLNAGVDVAENTEIQLICASPYVELIDSVAICPRLGHDEHINLQEAFKIKVGRDVPNQTVIAFQIVLDNGIMVQTFDFQRMAAAPILVIQPSYTLQTDDGQRTTHILNEGITEIGFKITNHGHCDGGPVIIDFNVLAPFVTVETPHRILDSLKPYEPIDLTFRLITQPNDLIGAWLKTKLLISNGFNEATYMPTIQYGGIFENFETDTLNPFFTWENNTYFPWIQTEADASEGLRCLEVTPPKNRPSGLWISTEGYIPEGKMSFFSKSGCYSTNAVETLTIEEETASGNKTQTVSSEDWHYWEVTVFPECETLKFRMIMHGEQEFGIRIDDICFPPPHVPIVFAGNDLISCKEAPIELREAYAYDCDSLYWTTNGDGHFENDTIANTQYHLGNQDLANGEVILTLHAVDSINSLSSSVKVCLLDEIQWESEIVGDSVVNIQAQPTSHYSIERQEGMQYIWQLEPASVGLIFDHGNEIDILWNLQEDNAEAILSVTVDSDCETEPIYKRISLIGTGITEWEMVRFDVFPNPTDGTVTLVMGENLNGNASVEVYNLLGERMLQKQAYLSRQSETLSLNLSGMASGLYIIKLSTENGSCSKKVSVK